MGYNTNNKVITICLIFMVCCSGLIECRPTLMKLGPIHMKLKTAAGKRKHTNQIWHKEYLFWWCLSRCYYIQDCTWMYCYINWRPLSGKHRPEDENAYCICIMIFTQQYEKYGPKKRLFLVDASVLKEDLQTRPTWEVTK